MKRIGLTASEEMSFENVDRRRDGRQIPSYTISSHMRLRLKIGRNDPPNWAETTQGRIDPGQNDPGRNDSGPKRPVTCLSMPLLSFL